MSSRIGIPRVGLFCFEASGLLVSWPPEIFSQATTPHMLPLHSATRMLATPSCTRQSPVGSAAKAGARAVAKNIAEYDTVRLMCRGQCNMVLNLCLCRWSDLAGQNRGAKRRIECFQLTK